MKKYSQYIWLKVISYSVIANGTLIIAGSLYNQLFIHNGDVHINDIVVSLPLLAGMTLVYLGTLLNRRKKAAWLVTIPLYSLVLSINTYQYLTFEIHHQPLAFIRSIVIPAVIVLLLIMVRRQYVVKSDIQSFRSSLRVAILMIGIIVVYGTAGYVLLDTHDFHQDITIPKALHHTVDQFDFTTDNELLPYTRRAKIFVDSLNIISAAAVAYVIVSLFQPIKAKFSDQTVNREHTEKLLQKYSEDSEDFFTIWPHDKNYIFSADGKGFLPFHIERGVALAVSPPIGAENTVTPILNSFAELCMTNDWLPAFVHLTKKQCERVANESLSMQKIGEEAVVDLKEFAETTVTTKYFRQIRNKFEKQNYSTEILEPPHQEAILNRLHEISDDWLHKPGRQERGFMMGYFSEEYIQQSTLVIARDAAGTVQGFVNIIPSYQDHEANFDLLRHGKYALGNINDYLLMAAMSHCLAKGYVTFNLGLCPLSGLKKESGERSVIDSSLRFLYANGDRFYSFSGLHRFKSKYSPQWRSRYIVYRGGVRNFTRTVYALNKAMNKLR